MFKNYFRTAWRNLVKYKSLSVINIGGLVVGIASALVLLSYVSFQSGYDGFNVRGRELYRVNLALYEEGKQVFQSAENYPALAPVLKKEIPEVLDAARLYNMGYKNNCVFTYNEVPFRETEFMYADASFLRMFTYPFVKGDPSTALSEPYSAVISASRAKKIFGFTDPIGKSLKMDDDDRNAELCKITGVFKDVPANSHLQFKILMFYSTLYHRNGGAARFESKWDRKDFYTYALLRPGADPALVQAKLAGVIARYLPDEKARHRQSVLSLEALSSVHLTTGLIDEPGVPANPAAISFLVIIAAFILSIGWINYINMTTASSANRAKEIGVRKVLGSRRGDLVRQFLLESFTLNMIAAVLAVGLVLTARPLLNALFHMHIELAGLLGDIRGWVFIGFIVLGSVLSGVYPAFVLSALRPVSVLKGKVRSQPSGLMLRKSLLVFQFALSIFLIIGTVTVFQQVHFMLNKDLGMNISQVVVLDRPGKWDTARRQHNVYVQRFKETLEQSPLVESVGMSDELPGKEIRNPGSYRLKNAGDLAGLSVSAFSVDEHFLQLLQFRFLAGRNFSVLYKTDKDGLVMTMSAARAFGFHAPQEAIGQQVVSDGSVYTVLGVVDDFHQLSLDKAAKPMIFQLNNSDAREFEYYLVKIKGAHTQAAIEQIRAAWNEAFRNNPFNFRFLNEDFNRQYNSVIQFRVLFAAFAFIAIVISCIGLFSLLAFMIQQRIKEIGIRKVLGAKVRDIVVLLSAEFLKLVFLANVVAWPLGWLLMNSWLKGFAYRIEIHLWLFVASGAAALVVAGLTISVQAVRAGLANPIRTLKVAD